MKFWQKAFLAILAVFIVSLDLCLYLTSHYSFALNARQEERRALDAYRLIAVGTEQGIGSISSRQPPGAAGALPASAVDGLMDSVAGYYARQGVYLALARGGLVLFSNLPAVVRPGRAPRRSAAVDVVRAVSAGGLHDLTITGPLAGVGGGYTLTSVTDLAPLYEAHAQLVRYLLLVSTVAEALLALALYLILRRLTRPVAMMERMARKIAGGVYGERIRVGGSDEFHDLADSFNRMAASIERTIAQLDQAVLAKQRLVDNLAHELRTPLTAMRGHAQYLRDARAPEAQRVKAATHILNATERMHDLVHKLLDLAVVRNGRSDLQGVDVADLLHQVELMTLAQRSERRIALHVTCQVASPLAGDPTLLQSLLVNLVDNAAKASAPDASIRLSAYVSGDRPVLEVRDHGIGMDESQLALAGEPFYRADPARSRASGGIGLGLALCREIARLHGAALDMVSRPGRGTTVRVIFATPLQVPEHSMTR